MVMFTSHLEKPMSNKQTQVSRCHHHELWIVWLFEFHVSHGSNTTNDLDPSKKKQRHAQKWWDPDGILRSPGFPSEKGNPRDWILASRESQCSHFWGIKLHYVHSWNPHLPVRVLYLEPVAPSCQYIRQRLTPCSKYIGNWKIRERYEIMETTTKWVPIYQLQNGVEKKPYKWSK